MLRPRICLVGPLLGRNPGYVVTQGERIAELLEENGYPAIAVSSLSNRYRRLLEIARTVHRERHRIDLLLIHCYGGPSFVVEDIASFLGARAGVPIILSLHGGAFPLFIRRHPRWVRRVLRRGSVLVSQSDYLARAVAPIGLQARIIPNVIDLREYPHRVRGPVRARLFWMRCFHEIYNPEMAIRVLARLRAEVPDATLIMAGEDKGMRRPMEALARQLGVAAGLDFPGFLDMDGKRRAAEQSDIFINTPRIDNRPVGVLEACALGLPVISTDVGGIPDLIEHERTGLLVPNGDVAAMAAAVLRLLREADLARRLSRNGADLASTSRKDRVWPLWESVIAEVVARHGLRTGGWHTAGPMPVPSPRRL